MDSVGRLVKSGAEPVVHALDFGCGGEHLAEVAAVGLGNADAKPGGLG
jgi:hypothetical protein